MIELKGIDVTFYQKKTRIEAVKNVSLSIEKGCVYGIVGYSGAGKSTLVRVINLLQRPNTGSVKIKGREITKYTQKELRQQRKKIGMIFQHFHLMKERTIYGNIDFALKYSDLSKTERQAKIEKLLRLVGLSDKKMLILVNYLEDKNNEWQLLELWQMTRRFCYVMKQLVP